MNATRIIESVQKSCIYKSAHRYQEPSMHIPVCMDVREPWGLFRRLACVVNREKRNAHTTSYVIDIRRFHRRNNRNLKIFLEAHRRRGSFVKPTMRVKFSTLIVFLRLAAAHTHSSRRKCARKHHRFLLIKN